MANYTWTDLIQDTTRYPDAMQVDLGEQGAVTLGELRGTVRREIQNREQRTTALAEEKRILEERLAYALAQPQQPPQPQPGQYFQGQPTPQQQINYNDYPALKPLHDTAEQARALALQQQQQLNQMAEMQRQMAQGLAQIPVVMRMEQLKSLDPGLDPAKLAEYVDQKRKQPSDLADYYKLMTYDQQLARAKEMGMQEGKKAAAMELAKTPAVPFAPYGPAQGMTLPMPEYKSLDEAESASLQDPDIINTFYGQG